MVYNSILYQNDVSFSWNSKTMLVFLAAVPHCRP